MADIILTGVTNDDTILISGESNGIIIETDPNVETPDSSNTILNITEEETILQANVSGGVITEPDSSIPIKSYTTDNDILDVGSECKEEESCTMPTKLSQLTNDMGFIVDNSYHHTDNNYTDEDKAAVEALHDLPSALIEVQKSTEAANTATEAANAVVGSVTTALTEVNSAVTQVNQALTETNEAISTINSTVDTAKSEIATTINDANTAISSTIHSVNTEVDAAISRTDDAIVNVQNSTTALIANTATSVNTFLTNAQESVDTAITNAETATTNATNATNSATTATNNANTATAAANAATSNLETVISNAETATTNANTAASNANTQASNVESALADTNTAITTVDNIVTEFTGLKTDLNTLKQSCTDAAEEALTEANYAKTQGDLAAGLNNAVAALQTGKGDGLAVVDKKIYLTAGGEVIGNGIDVPTGSGGTGSASILRVKNLTGTSLTTALGQQVIVSYTFSSLDSIDNTSTGDGTADYYVNLVKIKSATIAQGTINYDITSSLVVGINSVKIVVTDSYNATWSISINIEVVEVSLTSSLDVSQPITGEFTFRYTPIGTATKVIHFLVDTVEIATYTTTLSNRELSQIIPAQTHGSHVLEVYITATVNESNIESAHSYFDLICIVDGNNTPIITSSFRTSSIKQFTTINIPFYVYTPNLTSSTVTLYDGTNLISTRSVSRSLQTWAYRLSTSGANTLYIKCGDVTKTFNITVTEVVVNVSAETNDLELYLTSENRSNSDANKTEWRYNSIVATLSNFNYNTNGWVLDSSGFPTMRVGSGARITIPLNLFATDLRVTGKTIEFEFSVHGIYNYSTPVISCFSSNKGLYITSQDAYLKSEQTSISTKFKEEERIKLAFTIQKRSANRLINIYVNGINSQSVQYPDADNFTQATPVYISIGCDDATVDIYNIRSYSNDLNRYQLLDNYIADISDIDIKQAVFANNQIYDAYGNVNINLLNNFIPILTLIGNLPQYKGDKKVISVTYSDLLHPEKSFTASGVKIDVQGTSSQYYPRKNYKLTFATGFTMTTDNSVVSMFSLNTDNVIPAKVFTVKADFAESSGAHNTGIANYVDWLLKQLHYLTPPQQSNSLIRTTVYGEPICIAHKAIETDTAEFIGKYNFNTDKGAENTFGFSSGDESWEFLNNTSDRTLFKLSDYSTSDWQNDYEARYPDGNIDITKIKVVTDWIVSCGTDTTKFKNEINNYMDKNKVIFYYLFTLMFGMVDQRAKNQFLTEFQNGLWSFILYDNDTCLGINNEGALVFDYNIEIHDTIGTLSVWNGADSALWYLVENSYGTEIKNLYYTIRQNGYLTYDKLLTYLNKNQTDKWSEAVFNEDGHFKYELPLIDGYLDYSQDINNPVTVKTGAYLYALQGSRDLHRKWWLYNRINYLDSKYLTGALLSDTAVFRTYTPSVWSGVEPNANITVTVFNHMYLNIKWGSVTVSHRLFANETYTMLAPSGMTFNDTETIIYGASLILSLGDLSPLYVGSVDVSKMDKLSELIVGSGVTGYSNTNLTNISVGNNVMLKKLDVRNCPNLVNSLDLSGCKNITEILATGSGVSAIILPTAGIISKLYLPETITNLTIKNHPNLTDANFSIASYNNITTLILENLTLNEFAILQNCLSSGQLQRIRLIGINGSSNNSDLLYQLYNISGVDENGYNTTHAVLTGTFHITSVRADKLEELQGYFPELSITYDTLTYPPVITFVFESSQNSIIANGVFTSNRNYTKVNEYTYRVSADIGESITYSFSCDNHQTFSGEKTSQGDETVTNSITYIPLHTIRLYKTNTTIFIPNATATINGNNYTFDNIGALTIRTSDALSGTVLADTYNDGTISIGSSLVDITDNVYLIPQATITFTVKDSNNALVQSATVTIDNKTLTTNASGICSTTLKIGTYNYVARKDIGFGSGSVTIETSNLSIIVSLVTDISLLKPEENGNIQMLLQGTAASITINSTTTDYVIHWGDTTTSIATATGSQTYSHTYANTNNYQVEVSNCSAVTSCLPSSSSSSLIAYWSIGNSIVSGITFYGSYTSPYSNLSYCGDVFKNDINKTSFNQFSGCTGLTKISSTIFSNNTAATSFNSCFYRCTSLKSIPAGLFDHNTAVNNIDSCFASCSSLISIPAELFAYNTAVTNARACFGSCTSLTSIPAELFNANTAITDFSICFSGCTSLTSIPAGLFDHNTAVTTFESCFYVCSSLVSIPAGLFDHNTAVTKFISCFQNCNSLTSISAGLFNNNIYVSSFYSCFRDCHSLVSIPAGLFDNNTTVTELGSCFSGCTSLTSIPTGLFDHNTAVNSIGGCFSGCTSLTSIPTGLFDHNTAMLTFDSCFSGCTHLTSIELPTSFNNLGSSTYNNCTSLTYISTTLGIPQIIGTDIFSNTNNCPIYVPTDSLNTYKTATGWINYANRITRPPLTSDVTLIINFKTTENVLAGTIQYTILSGQPSYYELTNTNCIDNYINDLNIYDLSGGTTISVDCLAYQIASYNVTIHYKNSNGDTIKEDESTSYSVGIGKYNIVTVSPSVNSITYNSIILYKPNNQTFTLTDNTEITFIYITYSFIWSGNWTPFNTSTYGADSYKSNAISNNGSTIETFNCIGVTSVTFSCRSYGESGYDYLTIGQLDTACNRSTYLYSMINLSSATVWHDYTFNMSADTNHYIQFCYSKDGGGTGGDDACYVYVKSFTQ